eukprot:CAMPEP_0113313784 /NCGR_PEP_ID=MMETSP0010_2-20120614/10078_1 /TAXON_ID=216773 ORGANISM="Corethron hystrix, Strain 308" /NCGR_SAMPLE_ID=MMETSP0010_2 /ASSEMBLY_ACC=CAM_ASM_000155 /LENGTH=361 /DNA_ID=CAMNT_0000169883 /DNA_START=1422 /DNA_END=2503 /DNA_ORIENTATION=- /assembly_acc=CAM_ASM_000155
MHDSIRREIAEALILLGIELQKFSKWAKSLDLFTEVLNIFRSSIGGDYTQDITRVCRHIDSCALRNIILVQRGSCGILCLKHVNALCSKKKESGVALELKSHPGYGIVRMDDKFNFTGNKIMSWDYIFLGVGLKESSLVVNYDGRSMQSLPSGHKLAVHAGVLAESMPVAIMSEVQFHNPDNKETNEKSKKKLCAGSMLTVDQDGSIYPSMAPHLRLGIAEYPNLYLVDRGSPNRAVFRYFVHLQSMQKYNSETQPNEAPGTKLELDSHPGMGIVGYKLIHNPIVNKGQLGALRLGPAEEALSGRFNDENHLVFTGMYNGLAMTTGFAQNLKCGKMVYASTCDDSWFYDFKVNVDGTISPT